MKGAEDVLCCQCGLQLVGAIYRLQDPWKTPAEMFCSDDLALVTLTVKLQSFRMDSANFTMWTCSSF